MSVKRIMLCQSVKKTLYDVFRLFCPAYDLLKTSCISLLDEGDPAWQIVALLTPMRTFQSLAVGEQPRSRDKDGQVRNKRIDAGKPRDK